MRIWAAITIVGLSTFLVACFPDKGATYAQCKIDAAQLYPSNSDAYNASKYIEDCMRAKGYVRFLTTVCMSFDSAACYRSRFEDWLSR